MYYRVELQDNKTKLWFGAYIGSQIVPQPHRTRKEIFMFRWMNPPHRIKDKHNNFECWMTEKGFENFIEHRDFERIVKAYPGQYRIRQVRQFKRNEIKFRDSHQVVRLVSPKRRILKIIQARGI